MSIDAGDWATAGEEEGELVIGTLSTTDFLRFFVGSNSSTREAGTEREEAEDCLRFICAALDLEAESKLEVADKGCTTFSGGS